MFSSFSKHKLFCDPSLLPNISQTFLLLSQFTQIIQKIPKPIYKKHENSDSFTQQLKTLTQKYVLSETFWASLLSISDKPKQGSVKVA